MTGVAPVVGSESTGHDIGRGGATGRILRGSAANLGGVGVTLIIQLVSVPVLLAAWGVPTYGEWLVLSAIPTYVALSDLSFSSVAGNSMVMLVAQGKRSEAIVLGRRLWSVVTVMTGIGVLGAVAIALVIGGAVGSGNAIPASEAQVVLVALFIQVAVGNQYGVLDAWYRAAGRFPTSSALRNLGRLLEFGALIGAVLLGAGPGTAAIAFLAGSIAGFVVSWVVLRRAVPWSSFRAERPHFQTFRELLAPGMAFVALPIGNAVSLQGFTIVIGATLGAAAVVVFATTRTLTRVALQATSSINGAIWPELSRSAGSDRYDEARALLRGAMQVSLAVSLAFLVFLGLLGPSVIRSWTNGVVDPPRELLYVLLLVVVGNSVSNTLSTVLFATNQHRRLAVVFLIGAVVAVLAAVPLSSALGMTGAAIALLAIEVMTIVFVLPGALRVVHDRPGPFLRSALDICEALRLVKANLGQPT